MGGMSGFRGFFDRLRAGAGRPGETGGGGQQDRRLPAQPLRGEGEGGRGERPLRAVPRPGRAADDLESVVPEVALGKARVSAVRREIVLLSVLGVSVALHIVQLLGTLAVSDACNPVPIAVRVGERDDQLLSFAPMAVTGDLRATLTEKLLREYVEAREVIDLATEGERWKLIQLASSEDLSRQFFSMMSRDNPNSPYQRYLKDKKRRSADIISMSRIGKSDVWQAEVRTYDIDSSNMVISERYWVITMTIKYDQTQVTFENRFVNPYGLRITAYAVAPKGV